MSAEIRSALRKYIFRSAYYTEVDCGYNFIRNNINNVEDKQKLCIWKTAHHIGHIYSHISYLILRLSLVHLSSGECPTIQNDWKSRE